MLTLWPPGPEERKTSIRRSFGSMLTSTGSASGITSTPAAEVWIRPCDSVTGHALHAVHAALVLQQRPGAVRSPGQAAPPGRLDRDGHVLVAAEPGDRGVEDLGLPALPLGVPQVHAQQVSREQRRLLAALAGLDLEDDVLGVERVARHEQVLEPLLKLGLAAGELLGLLGERRVLAGQLQRGLSRRR